MCFFALQLKREELTLTCIQQFYMIADPQLPLPEATGGAGGASDPLDLEAPEYLMMPQHLQRRGGPVIKETLVRIFKHKYAHLKTLYSALAVGQSVIFVNSRRLAFFLALKLQKELSFSVSLICGELHGEPATLRSDVNTAQETVRPTIRKQCVVCCLGVIVGVLFTSSYSFLCLCRLSSTRPREAINRN